MLMKASRENREVGGHNLKMAEFLSDLKTMIQASLTTSMNKLAKIKGVDLMTISRAVKVDLGMKSYIRRHQQLLTMTIKVTRITKEAKLLNWLHHDSGTVCIFSDKKMWTVDQVRNARNDRFLAFCVDEIPPIHATKHVGSVMLLDVIASDGKRMLPFWFEVGLKIMTDIYEGRSR